MTTGVAVMARAPVPGQCKTRLVEGPRDAIWVARLYAAMLEDTLAALAPLADVGRVTVAPLPEIDAVARVSPHVPEPWRVVAQEGAELGARIAHAFAVLFATGATRAVVSGSDGPTLPFDALRADDADVVLLPCIDGGYGAIALRRPAPFLFEDMIWSTPRVLAETVARAGAAGLSVRLGPEGFDVDEKADLDRLSAILALEPMRAPRTARHIAQDPR